MTGLRWIVLVLTLLLPVVSPAVSAQDTDATPESSEASPVAAVGRQFDRSGLTLIGPGLLRAYVVIYESPGDAALRLPLILKGTLEETVGPGGEPLRVASTPKIGDGRKAHTGPYTYEDREAQAGVFGWREGSRVYVLVALGFAGDTLTPLFDLATALSGRTLPASDPILSTSPQELSSDGSYDLLPTLDDMPLGWVFTEDVDVLAETGSATPEPRFLQRRSAGTGSWPRPGAVARS